MALDKLPEGAIETTGGSYPSPAPSAPAPSAPRQTSSLDKLPSGAKETYGIPPGLRETTPGANQPYTKPVSDYKFQGSKIYGAMANKAAVKYGIDPEIFSRLIETESSWNPRATNSIGAIGLGQIMPETARELGIRDPWNAEQNIEGAARLFGQNLKRYNGNYVDTVAAYNGGDGAVQHARKHGSYANWGSKGDPNETKNYIGKILGHGIDYGIAYHSAQKQKETLPNVDSKLFNPKQNSPKPSPPSNPFQDVIASLNKPIMGTANAAEARIPGLPPGSRETTNEKSKYYVSPEQHQINSENAFLKGTGDVVKFLTKPLDYLNPIHQYQNVRKAIKSHSQTNSSLAYFDKFLDKHVDMPAYKVFHEGAIGNAVKNFDPSMQVAFEIKNSVELDIQKYGLAGAFGQKADKDPNSSQNKLRAHLQKFDFVGAKNNYGDGANMNKLLAEGGDFAAAYRLKHPVMDAVWTGGKQLFNPEYLAAGELGGRVLKGIGSGIEEAAKRSPKVAAIVESPLNPDVNVALRRAKGTKGVNAYQNLGREVGYAKEASREYVMHIYKGLTFEQKVEAHRLGERFGDGINQGMSQSEARAHAMKWRNTNPEFMESGKIKIIPDPKKGPLLLEVGVADRNAYDNVTAESLRTGALKAENQFGKNNSGVYSNRQGAYVKTIPDTAQVEAVRASRVTSKSGKIDGHKKYEFYDDIPKDASGEYSLSPDWSPDEQLLRHMQAKAVPNSEFSAGQKMVEAGLFEGEVEFRNSMTAEQIQKINKQRETDHVLSEWIAKEKEEKYEVLKLENAAKGIATPEKYRTSNGKIKMPELSESFGFGKVGEDFKKTESMRMAKAEKHSEAIQSVNKEREARGEMPWTPEEFAKKKRSLGDTELKFKDVRDENGIVQQQEYWTGKASKQISDVQSAEKSEVLLRDAMESTLSKTQKAAYVFYENNIIRNRAKVEKLIEKMARDEEKARLGEGEVTAKVFKEQLSAIEKLNALIESFLEKQKGITQNANKVTAKIVEKGVSRIGRVSIDSSFERMGDSIDSGLKNLASKQDPKMARATGRLSESMKRKSKAAEMAQKKTTANIFDAQVSTVDNVSSRLESISNKQNAATERGNKKIVKNVENSINRIGQASIDNYSGKTIDSIRAGLKNITKKSDQEMSRAIQQAKIIGKPAQAILNSQDRKLNRISEDLADKKAKLEESKKDYKDIKRYEARRESGLSERAQQIEEKHDKETFRYMESKGLGRVSQRVPKGYGEGFTRATEYHVAKPQVLDKIKEHFEAQTKMVKMTGLHKFAASFADGVRRGQLLNVSVHILGNVPFNALSQAKANGVLGSFIGQVGKGLVMEGQKAFYEKTKMAMPKRLEVAIEMANQRSLQHAAMGVHAPAMGGSGMSLLGGDTDHLLLKSWSEVRGIEFVDKVLAENWAWNGAVTFGGEKFVSDALGSALRETGKFTDDEVGRIVRSGLGDYENVKAGSWITKLIFFWPFTKGNDLLWLKLGLKNPEIGGASRAAVDEYNQDRGYKTDPKKPFAVQYGDKRASKAYTPIFFPDRKLGEFGNVYNGFTGDNIVDGFAALEKLATGTLQPGALSALNTVSTLSAPAQDPNTPGGFRTMFNKNDNVPNSEKILQSLNSTGRIWIGGYAMIQDALRSQGLIENNDSEIETHGVLREKFNQIFRSVFFFGSPGVTFSQKNQIKHAVKKFIRGGLHTAKLNRKAEEAGRTLPFGEAYKNKRNAAYYVHMHNILYVDKMHVDESGNAVSNPKGNEPTAEQQAPASNAPGQVLDQLPPGAKEIDQLPPGTRETTAK